MNTFLESTNILGIQVTTSPKVEILEFIKNTLIAPKKTHPASLPRRQVGHIPHHNILTIVTPNSEQIVLAQTDKKFAKILNTADVALPDGYGILLAAKFLNIQYPISNIQRKMQRIPGVEFMEELVTLAAKNGWPVAFIGGRGGVAEAALARLKKKYQGLSGWSWELPELSIGDLGNLGDLGEKIKQTNTKLVFVGLGAPKQEYFMERITYQVSGIMQEKKKTVTHDTLTHDTPLVLMSVGGSFDILAGSVRRAPVLIRSIGLEWLWRLVLEPWRFRRQLALIKFLWLVACRKLA